MIHPKLLKQYFGLESILLFKLIIGIGGHSLIKLKIINLSKATISNSNYYILNQLLGTPVTTYLQPGYNSGTVPLGER